MTPPAVARRVGRDPAVCRAAPSHDQHAVVEAAAFVGVVEGHAAAGGGPPALVLGFARLPEHRISEAVQLLAKAAATTQVGRAH
jgi:hypothetical protein